MDLSEITGSTLYQLAAAAAGPSPSQKAGFLSAMGKAKLESGQVAPVTATAQTAETATHASSNTVDAASRARQALELGRPEPTSGTTGDTLLAGLQKLRGTLNSHQSRLTTMMSRPVSDTNMLFKMQTEMSQFTLLLDVTSKLTGKSAQALETLLKS